MQSLDRDTVVLNEQDMPKIYWRRHKKPSINLIDDNPFTVDRQLEDQKYLQEYNKNPHVFAPSKIEKVRSEKIIAKQGASSALATKAKVLNKFVREASGVNSYAMIPPVRSKDKSVVQEVFDPETHPLVKPYRLESQRKPIMCSFGHRPKSASRTFFPATMKVRLDHNEVAPAGNTGKTGVGLSVAVLSKILHAPKLLYPNQLEDDVEEDLSPSLGDFDDYDNYNYSGVGDTGAEVGNVSDMYAALSAANHGTSSSNSSNSTKKNKKMSRKTSTTSASVGSVLDDISYTSKPTGVIDDRPTWSENFNIPYNPKEVYALKASGINNVKLPLNERLNRFATLTVSERQMNPFCSEKQKNDQIEAATGVPTKVKKSSPVKGVQKYYDPLETQFKNMQKFHKESISKQAEERKVSNYIANVKEIPQVDYHPADLNRKLKSNYRNDSLREMTCNVIDSINSSVSDVNASSKHSSEHVYTDTSMDSLEMKAKLKKKKKKLKSLGGSASGSCHSNDSVLFEFEHEVTSVNSSAISAPTSISKSSTAPGILSIESSTAPGILSIESSTSLSAVSNNDSNKVGLPPLSGKKQKKISKIQTTYSAPVMAMNLIKPREKTKVRSSSMDFSIASSDDNEYGMKSDKIRLKEALRSATKGNTAVLYDHYMKDNELLNDLANMESDLDIQLANENDYQFDMDNIDVDTSDGSGLIPGSGYEHKEYHVGDKEVERGDDEEEDDTPIFNPDY